jgi:hypothetical protein
MDVHFLLQINIVQQILCLLEGLLPSMKLDVDEEEALPLKGRQSVIANMGNRVDEDSEDEENEGRWVYIFYYKYPNQIPHNTQFELCRRTQQPSSTFRLVGGSTFAIVPTDI